MKRPCRSACVLELTIRGEFCAVTEIEAVAVACAPRQEPTRGSNYVMAHGPDRSGAANCVGARIFPVRR
jgi:hypothetical protein